MADKAVPAARFDGHAAVGSTGGDGHLLGDVAIVIEEILGGTPPKNHHRLCSPAMELSLHKVRMHVLTLLHMDIYTIPTGVHSTSSG